MNTSPRILRRFRGTRLGTRLFLQLRWNFTPYGRMASRLPRNGRILDLGCGHGLLSLCLAADAPGRQVLGIDHDENRIALARAASDGLPHLRFEKGSVLDPPQGPFEGITLIDVMHYFEPEAQARILRSAWERLAPGGILLVREVDPAGGPASAFNRFYEKLATATGFTRSANQSQLSFRTPSGWTEALGAAGFEVRSERCSNPLFADILFIGTKQEAGGPSSAKP